MAKGSVQDCLVEIQPKLKSDLLIAVLHFAGDLTDFTGSYETVFIPTLHHAVRMHSWVCVRV